MKRILIMMTEAGGGHRVSAEALRDAFHERFPGGFQIEIVDMWAKHTRVLLRHLPRSYHFWATEVPWIYESLYRLFEKEEQLTWFWDSIYYWVRKPVSQAFRQYNPDAIISVHPLMQEVPLRILSYMGWSVPFFTVVTDLASIHPTWLHPEVTLCFLPTEEARRQALEAGLREEQLRCYGLPIRPAFAQQSASKMELRRKLGLVEDLPAVLLMGGGEGMGPVGRIARAVAVRLAKGEQGRPAGQMVVVCGRNRKLQEALLAHPWPIPTRILGFVQNMPEWMSACDCIITKAGPGTIAEALACGLPIILSGFIPGQEEGNVSYVLEHGVGVYRKASLEIAETVFRWLGPEQAERERMAEQARRLSRPQAAFQIVEEIACVLATYQVSKPAQAQALPEKRPWLGRSLALRSR